MINRVTMDDLFPHMQTDDEIEGRGLWKSKSEGPCFSCGRQTVWIDLGFEAHICSMVCLDAANAGYWYAVAHDAENGGLQLEDHTVKSDLELTLDLVKVIYQSGEHLGWNKAEITRLVGRCLIAVADELEKTDGEDE